MEEHREIIPNTKLDDYRKVMMELSHMGEQTKFVQLETPAEYISRLNSEIPVLLFSYSHLKSRNDRVEKHVLKLKIKFAFIYLDYIEDEGRALEMYLRETTKQIQVSPPWLFILGYFRPLRNFVQGFHDGLLELWFRNPEVSFDYDLIIIGDGPGSLTAAEAAVGYGRRVLLCIMSYTKQLPWPDDMFELLHEMIDFALPRKKNFKNVSRECRKICKQAWAERVACIRKLGIHAEQSHKIEFRDAHTIYITSKSRVVTAHNFLITLNRDRVSRYVHGRALTVEEYFSRSHRPFENTLVFGKSKLAIETVSFLNMMHSPVTFMYPGVLLKHQEKECVDRILTGLKESGVRVESCIIEHISKPKKRKKVKIPPAVRFHYLDDPDEPFTEDFRIIIDATERGFDKRRLNLPDINMVVTGSHVCTNERDQTSLSNIFALGVIVHGRPQESVVTEQAGHLLIKRLYGGSDELMDYSYPSTMVNIFENPDLLETELDMYVSSSTSEIYVVPNSQIDAVSDNDKDYTEVNHAMSYGCVGFNEVEAKHHYGEENVTVYKTLYGRYDHLANPDLEMNFMKLICVKPGKKQFRDEVFDSIRQQQDVATRGDKERALVNCQLTERVVGIHIMAPVIEYMLPALTFALRMYVPLEKWITILGIEVTNNFLTE